MCGIVKKMGDEELQQLYDEGDKHNVGAILKDIWTTDLDRQQKQFSDDQATNRNLSLNIKILLFINFFHRQLWTRQSMEHNYDQNG